MRLKVFYSLKVYQVTQKPDEWQPLYRRCAETAGVEYVGSPTQPELARKLPSVNILGYPNTFAETSCISVMEALASGCFVVTGNWDICPKPPQVLPLKSRCPIPILQIRSLSLVRFPKENFMVNNFSRPF